MDPEFPENLVVADQPVARLDARCPHCGVSNALDVHQVTNGLFGSDEGVVLVCESCGGYAAEYGVLDRFVRAIRYIGTLVITLGITVGAPLTFNAHGGLVFTELPPLAVAIPVLGVYVFGLLASFWAIRGLIHVFRAPRVVALTPLFRMITK